MAVSLGSVNIYALEITPTRKKSMIHHTIPIRNGDRLQNMGFSSKMWEIRADLIGANKDADKTTLEGYFENDDSVTFVYESDSYTVKIENFIATKNSADTKWALKIDIVEAD